MQNVPDTPDNAVVTEVTVRVNTSDDDKDATSFIGVYVLTLDQKRCFWKQFGGGVHWNDNSDQGTFLLDKQAEQQPVTFGQLKTLLAQVVLANQNDQHDDWKGQVHFDASVSDGSKWTLDTGLFYYHCNGGGANTNTVGFGGLINVIPPPKGPAVT